MIKNGTRYRDIYNYRNSKHFIQTVKKARKYDEKHGDNLVIFAGACQSNYEQLIRAGDGKKGVNGFGAIGKRNVIIL